MTEKHYINPYRLFCGAFIPNWLMARPEISGGAKLCYGRLSQYAGDKGVAFPRHEVLGKELGCQRRMAINYVKELVEHGLVESIQTGHRQSNEYRFLAHPWMEAQDVDVQDSAPVHNITHQDIVGSADEEPPADEVQDSAPVQDVAQGVCNTLHTEENHLTASSSKKINKKPFEGESAPTDDPEANGIDAAQDVETSPPLTERQAISTIIGEFNLVFDEIFGTAMRLEARHVISPDDEDKARMFHRMGATPAVCRGVFEQRQRRQHSQKKPPIT